LAALVNGQYVFLADYEREVAQYEQAIGDLGVDPNSEEGQVSLAQARQDILEGLIDEVLIEQAAAELGVSLSDEEVEAQVEADITAGGGQAAFDEWLQATGQTRDDYKEILRRSLMSQRAWDSVVAGVPAAGEQIHVRTIVVESEEEAQEIVGLIRGGADFAALAQERSQDLVTAEDGGDLGWFPRGVLAVELEDAAFALQPGEVSEPVALGGLYHVLLLVERDAARAVSQETLLQLQQAAFEQWLAELRERAVIERFVSE